MHRFVARYVFRRFTARGNRAYITTITSANATHDDDDQYLYLCAVAIGWLALGLVSLGGVLYALGILANVLIGRNAEKYCVALGFAGTMFSCAGTAYVWVPLTRAWAARQGWTSGARRRYPLRNRSIVLQLIAALAGGIYVVLTF